VFVVRLWRGCGRHLPAPRKSIPAIVLNLERSVGGFEKFQVNNDGCGVDATGISRPPEKVYRQ